MNSGRAGRRGDSTRNARLCGFRPVSARYSDGMKRGKRGCNVLWGVETTRSPRDGMLAR